MVNLNSACYWHPVFTNKDYKLWIHMNIHNIYNIIIILHKKLKKILIKCKISKFMWNFVNWFVSVIEPFLLWVGDLMVL